MALKDWKRVNASSKELRWQKAKKGRITPTLRIRRIRVPGIFTKDQRLEYQVSIGYMVEGNGSVENWAYYYKIKAKALQYAKSYMRSH